ncbi:hypothetical protein H0H93_015250 [Arthromyces matolae]|nr:hypothetical protein H0H93_015250 [Arthromyces matolae]
MYTGVDFEEDSNLTARAAAMEVPLESFNRTWLSEFASRYVCGSDQLSAALQSVFEEISNDSLVLSNFKLPGKIKERSSLLELLDTPQLQALVDLVFSALQVRKVGVVLLSEFLARIWHSTRLLPSHVKFSGVETTSSYPFATTPTSNVFSGFMTDGTQIALKTCRQSQSRPATIEDMQFQKYGSLPEYLSRRCDVDKLQMAQQVAAALLYLHSQDPPILHGDVRGMNVLVDDFGQPLLMDMGFSLVMDPLTSTFTPDVHRFVGNPRWTPWEKVAPSEFPLTLKADSFSFASFLLEVNQTSLTATYRSDHLRQQ